MLKLKYITYIFLKKVRLKERRHTNHPFDRDTIFLWSKEMLLGLNFLHEHLIIHRDIKPAYELLKIYFFI